MSDHAVRPKALFIVNSLVGGGAERICVYLANAMLKDVDVDIVTLYDDDASIAMPGIHVESLGISRDAGKTRKLAQLAANAGKLDGIIRERERFGTYRLITSHLTAANILTSFSGVSNRCLYVHHSLPSAIQSLYPAPLMSYVKRMYRRAQSVSVSDGVRDQAIQVFGVDPSKIVTIYNCVPLDHVREMSREGVPFERPFLLSVGRLTQSKRLDRMLKIYIDGGFSKNYDLVFLGEGPMQSEAERMAEDGGVGNSVHFMGYVDNPYAWMRASSAMVMSSDREALPTVLVEGLMAGAHVVSSDCDFGPREILTGGLERYLVGTDDIGGYIEAIKEATENYPKIDGAFFDRYRADEVIRRYQSRYDDVFERGVNG